MSDLGYIIWFIAMAIMTATILTVGILIASDVIKLPSRRRARGSTVTLRAVDDLSPEHATDDPHEPPGHHHAA